jgi:hypothetical protein
MLQENKVWKERKKSYGIKCFIIFEREEEEKDR